MKIALFDMDGTLFDYVGELSRQMEEIRSPEEKWTDPFEETPYLNSRRKLIKSFPGFWRDLPKYKPGWDILHRSRIIGYDIHILTKGPRIPSAWTEKVECIHNHFSDATIHITEDKSVHYGRVLVDDYPDYIESWLKYRQRGLVIMPAHDYNKGFSHPNVIRYTDNIIEVNNALMEAYDRA